MGRPRHARSAVLRLVLAKRQSGPASDGVAALMLILA
jgi:hypothetical protein